MLPTTPFEDRLGTNYVPSEDDVATIQELIKVAEPQIVSLDAEIEALKQKRAVFASFVTNHRALISPIRRMPPDILRNVFSYCLARKTPGKIMKVTEAPLLLAQICSNWRDLVINTPTLWSTIHIDIPIPSQSRSPFNILPYGMVDVEERGIDVEAEGASEALSASFADEWRRKMKSLANLTSVWLSRAETCPLTIFLLHVQSIPSHGVPQGSDDALTRDPLDFLLSLICARSSQWSQLDLQLMESSLCGEPLLSLSSSHTPNLQSIHVKWSSSPPRTHSGSGTKEGNPSLHIFKSKSLQRLFLQDFSGSCTDIPVGWSNLTELSLAPGVPRRRYYGHNPPDATAAFTPSIALEVLQRCPNLVQCEVHLSGSGSVFTDSATVSKRAHLPRLKRLVVFENTDGPSTIFFKSLDLPSMTSISWSSLTSPYSQFSSTTGHPCLSLEPLLLTSGHQLRFLEFGAFTAPVATLVASLKLAVAVAELTIDLSRLISPVEFLHNGYPPPPFYRDELLAKLTPSEDAAETICPNLTTLRLRLSESSDITTKALKKFVVQRGAVGHAAGHRTHVPVTNVSVRFLSLEHMQPPGRSKMPTLPKRWQEDQLNSGLNGHIIKVECRKPVSQDHCCPPPIVNSSQKPPLESYWDFDSGLYE
ncbi:hypothetical protein BKA70DRAFT_1264747 [Coprinopsis sp. MPI-PUGE-AT-0042]|nr:hypothetical protein BKA70DRAFT_1264747 [Coprinopsis sp. MPI-PUGE-AT-0042]